MPDWYPVLRAARYLGVPPWELEDQWIGWMDRALMAEAAEAVASQPAPSQTPRRRKR
jgi:hypothetical protein